MHVVWRACGDAGLSKSSRSVLPIVWLRRGRQGVSARLRPISLGSDRARRGVLLKVYRPTGRHFGCTMSSPSRSHRREFQTKNGSWISDPWGPNCRRNSLAKSASAGALLKFITGTGSPFIALLFACLLNLDYAVFGRDLWTQDFCCVF